MATSGTATFNLDLVEVVEEAFERCGAEMRTGYDLRTARRSLNLMFAEWANLGVNLWTIEQGVQALTPGVATYQIPADTVDLLEHVIRTPSAPNNLDITISRISVSTYSSIPNKAQTGRPIQLYIDRQRANPTVTVWPVPDNSQPYTLVYWRLRRIQDAGEGVNTMDVPFRFIPCLVAGLAYHMAMKIPGALERLPILKTQYEEAWALASEEDREKAPVRFVPRVARI
jgi:hypothetical protein